MKTSIGIETAEATEERRNRTEIVVWETQSESNGACIDGR
jgi:hypothetical protein